MTPMQVHPERASFDRLATGWPLVPVWAEVLADVGTPVGLFPAVAGDGPGLLLESVERSERWGRYSFMAGDPAAVMIADDDGLHLRDVARELPVGEPSRRLTPREALRAAVNKLKAPRLEGLPPITGGLMGYASYEAAGLLDGHPAPHAEEAPLPPIGLLLIDRAVVLDHWRQRLILVVHAQRGGYDDAVDAIEELASKIAGAAPLPLLEPGEADAVAGTPNMEDAAYRAIVASFKDHILAGDIFQGVPSRRVSFAAPEGGFPIYRRLRVSNPRDEGGVTYALIWTGCPSSPVSAAEKSMSGGHRRWSACRTIVVPSAKRRVTAVSSTWSPIAAPTPPGRV